MKSMPCTTITMQAMAALTRKNAPWTSRARAGSRGTKSEIAMCLSRCVRTASPRNTAQTKPNCAASSGQGSDALST